ncbi:hypothetical protein C6361_29650 [Plantactinospora sp. BC1]|nr:hypothetical protein C6361_29650 [Plantactinospora sp. BC1]
MGDRLPAFVDGGDTLGIFSRGGIERDLASGVAGPASSLPKGTPGFNGLVKSHVEGHAAALMRQNGIPNAELYINRVPCGSGNGCAAMLPHMLPEGATLRVYGPNGYDRTFTGLPD